MEAVANTLDKKTFLSTSADDKIGIVADNKKQTR